MILLITICLTLFTLHIVQILQKLYFRTFTQYLLIEFPHFHILQYMVVEKNICNITFAQINCLSSFVIISASFDYGWMNEWKKLNKNIHVLSYLIWIVLNLIEIYAIYFSFWIPWIAQTYLVRLFKEVSWFCQYLRWIFEINLLLREILHFLYTELNEASKSIQSWIWSRYCIHEIFNICWTLIASSLNPNLFIQVD